MRTTSIVLPIVLLVGVTSAADSLYVRLVGRLDFQNPAFGVVANGDYAYVANSYALRVISVADPSNLIEVGHCDVPGEARGVAVVGDVGYVTDDVDSSLRVVSVADRAHPSDLGRCRTPGQASAVAVSGDYAYVADGELGLRVISIADAAHPVEVGHCDLLGGFAYHLAVSGGHVYVADFDGGLRIISVTDPAHPVEVGYSVRGGNTAGVAVSGDYAYVAYSDSGLGVISVVDPTHPVEVGRCYGGLEDHAQDVVVARDYAFVATWSGGLRVVSVADPVRPVEVGHYRFLTGWSVATDRDYVYVCYDSSMAIFQFYQPGDLDVDDDSLDVVADTLRLRSLGSGIGEPAIGEFILANTSAAYNPDPLDGPSMSPVDSLGFTGALSGPGGSIDSILIPNLPRSLAQGQTVTCTLVVYPPPGLKGGDYSGLVTITGKDTAGLLVQEDFHALIRYRLGDLDIDNDSLDVANDTIRVRPRLVSSRPPPEFTEYAYGEFILANTSPSYNPDTADGPSQSAVDSLSFIGSLVGPGGLIDSIAIPNLPRSLSQGQAATCTLAVYVPPSFAAGDYAGSIIITGHDSLHYEVAETVYALVTKLGDLDVDNNSLGVVRDTMNLHTQPAGPVYSPYAKATFMLVNTSSAYNPDAEDGPSQSPLRAVKVEAKVEAKGGGTDSVYVLNLPESLAVGQAVECTLALVIPAGESLDNYSGFVAIDAYDTAGYRVRDSFFLVVRGPQPRENLDSLRVAPIPFKPNQNPEHDAIHFQGLSAGARVTVYDASGLLVWSATENGDGHLAWKAEVASGIYVYLVVSADGKASKVGKLSVIR